LKGTRGQIYEIVIIEPITIYKDINRLSQNNAREIVAIIAKRVIYIKDADELGASVYAARH
jgi:hypothetical protein